MHSCGPKWVQTTVLQSKKNILTPNPKLVVANQHQTPLKKKKKSLGFLSYWMRGNHFVSFCLGVLQYQQVCMATLWLDKSHALLTDQLYTNVTLEPIRWTPNTVGRQEVRLMVLSGINGNARIRQTQQMNRRPDFKANHPTRGRGAGGEKHRNTGDG